MTKQERAILNLRKPKTLSEFRYSMPLRNFSRLRALGLLSKLHNKGLVTICGFKGTVCYCLTDQGKMERAILLSRGMI